MIIVFQWFSSGKLVLTVVVHCFSFGKLDLIIFLGSPLGNCHLTIVFHWPSVEKRDLTIVFFIGLHWEALTLQ